MNDTRTYEQGFRDGVATANGVAADLEERWRAAAAKTRADGTCRSWFFGWRVRIAPAYEKNAKTIESAADGIKAIREIGNTLQPPSDVEP